MAKGPPQIHTPDQRLRVFVSSTIQELERERAAVAAAIRGLKLTPVLFELGARPYAPREVYCAYLDQSQVFVGIYGESYGWIAPDMTISGLEDEYLLSGDRPKLIYVKEPAPAREPRLAALLRQMAEHDRICFKVFGSPEELAAMVADDLAVLLSERFETARAGAAPVARSVASERRPARRLGRRGLVLALAAAAIAVAANELARRGSGPAAGPPPDSSPALPAATPHRGLRRGAGRVAVLPPCFAGPGPARTLCLRQVP